MIVLYIILRPFTAVDTHLFADTVLDIGFAQQSVTLVFYVGKDRLYHSGLPYDLSHRRGNTVCSQSIGNLLQAVAGEKFRIDSPYCYRLCGINFRLSVCTLTVSEEGFISEGHIAFLCALPHATLWLMFSDSLCAIEPYMEM